ncbi:MAG: glucose-1-phosphate thymidylyltransferase [Acidimicrobiia bacterium]|nr:glucose-1-phosphate thymidylyltransferase [Acidimicrobiia bacterium]MXZ76846.1 glucose-1-phosphate thymidylyltransferase [Acidimicrobiia bacterium]MXZ85547.1 glucose-1-phosphate thymidylyltransferase [Acidimicrobiia bacterium]MYB08602.1 glucose-1-phosphate thymidylyltransferase [Acidimicrobiia bacterium]MYB74130.1 glucose-1-phosphate thymidylyltransferase [Acidimicrobiia bacterium]
MKGLILSGGEGTRLRPLTHTRAKQLVPIANKPVLFYGIEELAAAGITEIAIVVGETHQEIRDAVGDGSDFGVSVTYIRQEAPLGLAHCVLIAEEFLGDDCFVMYLGDNMLEQGLGEFVDRFEKSREQTPSLMDDAGPSRAQILLTPVNNPSSFGVAELNADGDVVNLVEKPADPPSNLALVGVYIFDSAIHEAVRSIEPSARGELEITDAIFWLIQNDYRVSHQLLDGWWIDTGKKDPLLECNRLVLDTVVRRLEGAVDDASKVEGRVVISEGAKIVNSTVRGPAVIGANTRIENTFIGPYTSIGDECVVVDAELDHSVVLEGCRIDGIGRITDSLIGQHVQVTQSPERPQASRLMLGDHSHLELG